MHALGYRIGQHLRLEQARPDQIQKMWRDDEACLWLDIQGSCREAREQYLKGVEISEILTQLCEEENKEIARVIPSDDAVYFGLPVCVGPDRGEIAYLDALCLPRLLITLHSEAIHGMQGLAQALQRSSVPAAPTTSALVCVLLMHFSALSVQEAQRLRRRVRNLSDQMDRDADALELERLLAEKVAVRQLEMLDEESSPVYAALRVTDTPALNLSDLRSYYDVVLSNTAFLTRIVDRLGASLDDLHQRYVVNMQEKTNKRLAFLTVVSAIFLPLTLLAGIYGMNFQFMPELNLRYAYPAMLGVMLAIAVGLWRYFKRKGWFD
jgi:magnesium transporter